MAPFESLSKVATAKVKKKSEIRRQLQRWFGTFPRRKVQTVNEVRQGSVHGGVLNIARHPASPECTVSKVVTSVAALAQALYKN